MSNTIRIKEPKFYPNLGRFNKVPPCLCPCPNLMRRSLCFFLRKSVPDYVQIKDPKAPEVQDGLLY